VIRTMLKSKIHRAVVTEANLEYEGSITIDTELMAAADLLPYEQVCIYDCTNGNRLSTYVIPGEPGSGEICINGAAAHLVKPLDRVIIASYVQADDAECRGWEARRVFVDEANRPRD
jgi:aspartate 1-decarboxylase